MALGALGSPSLRAEAAQSCINVGVHTEHPQRAHTLLRTLSERGKGTGPKGGEEAEDLQVGLPLPLGTLKYQPTFAGSGPVQTPEPHSVTQGSLLISTTPGTNIHLMHWESEGQPKSLPSKPESQTKGSSH